jgi:PAS domain S-box-containing protein
MIGPTEDLDLDTVPSNLQQRVYEAIDANPGAMVTLIDEQETLRFVSPTSRQLFGYEPSEMVGKHISDFLGQMDIEHVRLMIQDAILNGESVDASREVWLKFGGTKCMHGPGRGYWDRAAGRAYVLAIGRPCGEAT